MARTKKIAVIGFGNIGTGVVRLLYEKGIAGLELVSDLRRRIGFRASFVGGHSLIHELGLAGTGAKKFRRIYAILNGTSNYILSTMSAEGQSFEAALKEAQAKGFAESDPSDDIDGKDT